jgi:hypothetical protein
VSITYPLVQLVLFFFKTEKKKNPKRNNYTRTKTHVHCQIVGIAKELVWFRVNYEMICPLSLIPFVLIYIFK